MPTTGSLISGRLAGGLSVSLLVTLALLVPAARARSHRGAGAPVAVYLTTPGDSVALARQTDARFRIVPTSGPTITVSPSRRFQMITGFGAAFTDSSLWLLSRLPEAQRAAALRALLDPRSGIGVSLARLPIGASDYTASDFYTYDDLAPGQTDPALRRFSLTHDQGYAVPVLRQAFAIDPALKILASPWSPPAWMKTNDSLMAVSPEGTVGTLLPSYYGALARYFVRFIEAYRAAGVPVWAITPQNEPLQATNDYPGMIMAAPEEAQFVGGYLAPALRAAGLPVRIYGYDYLWLGSQAYAKRVLRAAAAGRDLSGVTYHCYFGLPATMSEIHAVFPGADQLEDECSTGISVLSPIQVEIRSVENWASGALMWNMDLDPSGGPKIGTGCPFCLGLLTVDPSSGTVTPTGDYYEIGQVSKFVRPGARRIGLRITPRQPACGPFPVCGLEAAAFRDSDGREILVVTNSGSRAVTFSVRQADRGAFTYTLPGQVAPTGTDNSRDAGVVTFVWR